MKTRLLWFLLILLTHSFLFSQNSSPEVTNVNFSQRSDGSFIVDIYYDVSDADSNGMLVTMEASDDGGITWNFPCFNTNGDIGGYILSGTSKHIIWDFGSEHPNILGDQFRLKITADDEPLMDIDGNKYHIIKIGNQWWMAENLKTTYYRNGEAIPNVTDNSEWAGLSTGAYCAYDNDISNVSIYGLLYNWYAVDDSRNIAPTGWHVPTDEEYTALENYLIANGYNWDGTTTEDKTGKSLASKTGWNSYSIAGTVGNDMSTNNASGFSALPGGYRYYGNGTFDGLGSYGYWWSATEYSSTYAWGRRLGYYVSDFYRYYGTKRYGFSIRLIRD